MIIWLIAGLITALCLRKYVSEAIELGIGEALAEAGHSREGFEGSIALVFAFVYTLIVLLWPLAMLGYVWDVTTGAES